MRSSQLQPNNVPERDQELLSAYLDNEMTSFERASFERRLQQEPILRAELEELRATVALFEQMAPLPPPRSFTLDPATAPRRAWAWPSPRIFQLGGGFAGLMVMVLLSLRLFTSGGMPAASPMAASAPTEAAAAITASEAREAAPAAQAPKEEAATLAPEMSLQPQATAAPADAAGIMGMGGDPSIDATISADQTNTAGAAGIAASDTSSPDTTTADLPPVAVPGDGNFPAASAPPPNVGGGGDLGAEQAQPVAQSGPPIWLFALLGGVPLVLLVIGWIVSRRTTR